MRIMTEEFYNKPNKEAHNGKWLGVQSKGARSFHLKNESKELARGRPKTPSKEEKRHMSWEGAEGSGWWFQRAPSKEQMWHVSEDEKHEVSGFDELWIEKHKAVSGFDELQEMREAWSGQWLWGASDNERNKKRSVASIKENKGKR